MFVRRRRSDGSAQSLGRQLLENETQIGVVNQYVLRVDRKAVSERRRFGGLQMRERHADEVAILTNPAGKHAEQAAQILTDQ